MAKEYKRKNAILDKINELKKYGFHIFQQKKIGKKYYLVAGRPFFVINENYLEALDELLVLAKMIDKATAEYIGKHQGAKNESHK